MFPERFEYTEILTENTVDLRPFLYPLAWKSWGFKKIDRELEKIEKKK
jgi:NAD+ synthase (glutamine-hydrolysing)